MKTIKMFEGVKLVTDKGTHYFRDLEILKVINCPVEGFETELTRALICSFPEYVDLSEFADDYEVFKLRIITCSEGEKITADGLWEVVE